MAGSESGLIRSGSVREKLNALYLIVTKRINVYRGPKYPALRFSIGGLVSQNWQAKRAKQNLWELAVYKMWCKTSFHNAFRGISMPESL
jgi:hypothetical protein